MISLNPEALGNVKAGLKTIEGRLNSPRFKDLEPGNYITFYYNQDNVRVKVVKLEAYKNFDIMLKRVNLNKLNPKAEKQEEIIKVYRKPTGFYTEEKEKEHGVLAIYMELAEE